MASPASQAELASTVLTPAVAWPPDPAASSTAGEDEPGWHALDHPLGTTAVVVHDRAYLALVRDALAALGPGLVRGRPLLLRDESAAPLARVAPEVLWDGTSWRILNAVLQRVAEQDQVTGRQWTSGMAVDVEAAPNGRIHLRLIWDCGPSTLRVQQVLTDVIGETPPWLLVSLRRRVCRPAVLLAVTRRLVERGVRTRERLLALASDTGALLGLGWDLQDLELPLPDGDRQRAQVLDAAAPASTVAGVSLWPALTGLLGERGDLAAILEGVDASLAHPAPADDSRAR